VVGTEVVAHAAPDGNTILITNTAFVTNPHLRPQNYDPLTSFEPVCAARAARFHHGQWHIALQYPERSLNAARAAPGQLTMATFAEPRHISG